MPHRQFLSRIKQMLRAPGARFQSIRGRLKGGRLKGPAPPMTDQELARAIREFQATRVSDRTLWRRHESSEGT
jgi:hypothetical protein